VSGGGSNTCGVTAAGAAYCWGSNIFGQLGDGDTAQTASPAAVSGGLSFAAVGADVGGQHRCAVTTTGAAYCWGINNTGQLGIGTTSGPQLCGSNPCSMTPVAVLGGLTFTMVNTGGDVFGHGHVCGVTAAAAAYCWGDNVHGQLGDGTVTRRTSPVAVGGGLTFADVGAGSNYDFTEAPGYEHTCGVTTAGVAYCWGVNANGQLGTGTTTGPQNCAASSCSTMPVAVLGGLSFEP
jgi:alpha-tubulin suppressor-like RCC1 family protein